ncbi:MAG TPA: AI-2E family transporter [Candidatus Saccharimonadales bacterium]
MNVTLRVETRTIVRFITVVAIFGLTIFAVWKTGSALTLIGISLFLALALNPPVSRMARLLPHNSRIGATALAYIVMLTILGLFAYVAAPPIVQQTNDFVNNFPAYIEDLSKKQGSFSQFLEKYQLQDELDEFVTKAKQESGAIAGGIGSSVVSGVSSVLNGTISLITILVLTFLMLIEGPAWVQRMWRLYSDNRKLKRDQRLITRMYKVVTGYVNGQVLVAGVNAACAMVVLFILTRIFSEVPLGAVLPLTGIIFIAALIPMFGATIGAIIATTVLLFNNIPAAIIFLVYYILYQQVENNVIQPVVQARTVQLSALGVVTAAIIGITLFGLIGAIIAIPVAGCVRVLIADYIENKHDYVSHHPEQGKLVAVGPSTKKGKEA